MVKCYMCGKPAKKCVCPKVEVKVDTIEETKVEEVEETKEPAKGKGTKKK